MWVIYRICGEFVALSVFIWVSPLVKLSYLETLKMYSGLRGDFSSCITNYYLLQPIPQIQNREDLYYCYSFIIFSWVDDKALKKNNTNPPPNHNTFTNVETWHAANSYGIIIFQKDSLANTLDAHQACEHLLSNSLTKQTAVPPDVL